VVNPWSHYQLINIKKKMKKLDPDLFSQEYEKLIEKKEASEPK